MKFHFIIGRDAWPILSAMITKFSGSYLFFQSSLVGVNGRESSSHSSYPLHSTPSSPRMNSRKPNPSSPGTHSRAGQSAHSIKSNLQRPVFMLESCFVIRCEEFFIMPVTTSNVGKEETAFLSSDKKALYLPSDMPAFQLDFTQYYYPGSIGSAGNRIDLDCKIPGHLNHIILVLQKK